MVTATARRTVVTAVQRDAAVSERRACGWLGFGRATVRYQSRRPPATAMTAELVAWAERYPRWGDRQLQRLLRRAGHAVNRKRVHRLYRL